MLLAGELHNKLFTVVTGDALDQDGPGFDELRDAVMMRVLDLEFRSKVDPRFVEHGFDFVDRMFDDQLVFRSRKVDHLLKNWFVCDDIALADNARLEVTAIKLSFYVGN